MPSALADLTEATEFIARDSARHAKAWLSGAWIKIFGLAENPKSYAVIPESAELGVELRSRHHHSHRVIFWVRDEYETVEILRVYHGARRALTQRDIA
jgi:hypothetical protein